MGFFDKLRNELIDIIEWVEDDRQTLVWRFPRYQNEIKNGAQLIVRPGQKAIFVHQGQIADIFEDGHHTLETKNLPILSTIMGWKYGFNSPFKAEVYFVSTRQITELKWGTPNPIMMRDADFGPIRIRAFGTYSLRALEPKALLRELVGTDSRFETSEINELMRSLINSTFADVIASSKIPALDLAASYTELAEKLRLAVYEQIDDEYGLDIPFLKIVNISLPEEVEKAIDARSSMAAIGNMQAYQQYQMGKSMPAAAENPAGGIAGAGLGLGMGMAMANQMGGFQAGPQQHAAGGAPPPPPPPAAWHLAENGQTVGPFDMNGLAAAVQSGRLKVDTLVWSAGMSGWTAAGQVPQLAALFQANTPPPPPPPAV